MQGPVPNSDDIDALVGSVVAGKYRIDRVLGRGGMGAVFSATNTTIGKRVALKFLTREAARDKSATQRFQREAEAAGVIESEHIVHVFDSGTTEEGLPFLVMELLSGEDLRSRLQRDGMLPVGEAVDITTQVLRGLVRAHAAGIIHRDLKPDNIFLCPRDDGSTLAKIVDFGISKLSHGRSAKTLTRRGTVLGTAYYMAPEQAQAAEGVDHRADLYGAGTILFEMLAGRPPHVAPTHEAVLVAICTEERSRRPHASPGNSGCACARARTRPRPRTRRTHRKRQGISGRARWSAGSRRCLPSAHGGTRGERAPRRKHHRATSARFATHSRRGSARRAARLHADGRAGREEQRRRFAFRRPARDGRTGRSVRIRAAHSAGDAHDDRSGAGHERSGALRERHGGAAGLVGARGRGASRSAEPRPIEQGAEDAGDAGERWRRKNAHAEHARAVTW